MFDRIFDFESALATYTGAPYAVMTDCCTHAIELCLIYRRVKALKFSAFTYISIPMLMEKLNISYDMITEKWHGEYRFYGTDVWDSARKLEPNMYRSGQMQCLSFGHTKPLAIGRGGAILLDDFEAYRALSQMRSDGRDLAISPWQTQQDWFIGYHYRPTIEEAVKALDLLHAYKPTVQNHTYPDCRHIIIKNHCLH